MYWTIGTYESDWEDFEFGNVAYTNKLTATDNIVTDNTYGGLPIAKFTKDVYKRQRGTSLPNGAYIQNGTRNLELDTLAGWKHQFRRSEKICRPRRRHGI